MWKKIFTFFMAIIATAVFTGCVGGSTSNSGLKVPVKNRTQDVNPKVMDSVNSEVSKQFDEGVIKKYKSSKRFSFGELKEKNRELHELMLPILQEARKMYKQRNLPKDILSKGPKWLIGDLDKLNITLAKGKKSNKFNGQYSPFDNILLVNYSKSVDKDLVRFLLAHEIAHAIGLHVSEDKTTEAKSLEGAEDATTLALDIALNAAYSKLGPIANILDRNAKSFKGTFYTQKDIENEQKIAKNRENSLITKAAMVANQTDKLSALGIGLSIPVETKLALKGLMNNGLEQTEAINALKGGIKFANTQVVVMSGHTRDQEMEADAIALELTKRAGFDVKRAACKRFEGNKKTGIFDNHPSYDVRRANLGCSK